MGRRRQKHHHTKSHTLPSSPTHSFSSSSSDFEFTISISPRKSSATADELFYKGQLLPLHLSPRLSMVRTLLLSDSSSDTTSRDSTSRDSTASSSSLSSSRPSSALAPEDDNEFKRLTNVASTNNLLSSLDFQPIKKSSKYFSLAKLSSVFRNKAENRTSPCPQTTTTTSNVKRVSASAKEVIRKYLKKVKPLYEKLSSSQNKAPPKASRSANTTTICMVKDKDQEFSAYNPNKESASISHSFSGNLRYPRRKRSYMISSCPSSMMSSPSHCKSGFGYAQMGRAGSGICSSDASSMEELQSAIQGAIAHCKNSMLQNNKAVVSNEI